MTFVGYNLLILIFRSNIISPWYVEIFITKD